MINMKKRLIKRIALVIFSVIIILICIGPIFYVFWNASKSTEEYDRSNFSPPTDFSNLIKNIKTQISAGIFNWILNSLIVVTITVALTAIFTSMAGYSFAKLDIPGKNLIYWLIISVLAMPTQVFLIPLYVMFSRINMINNLLTLALIYTGFHFAFGTFLMTSFYRRIPTELLESARIDGANNFQMYFKIMVPLGMPAITTLAVLNFFSTWNELLFALIFNHRNEVRLVTPGLALFRQIEGVGGSVTQWPLIYTGMLISLILPFIVYFIFQNRIAAGITVGALKE